MNAHRLHHAGGIENFSLENLPRPTPAAGEVLIDTRAISVNPVDFKVRPSEESLNWILGTEERPVILGWDVAGVVSEVGEGVEAFSVGDRVFGMINFPGHGKAYAEVVAAPASHLAHIPANTSFEDAAATTLAALTALQVLDSRVQAGDRVLIHAGSGGVGHFAIQIAKNLGATVITTSSAKNREFVLSLGADEHVDYREQKFEEVLSDIDFILDGMGGDVLENSMKLIKDGGGIVSLPTHEFEPAMKAEAEQRGIRLEFVLVQSNGDDMQRLANMLADGQLTAHVSQTFPFSDLPQSHLQLESGRTVGKVVVTVNEGEEGS